MRFPMRILALVILLLGGCRYRSDIGGEDADGDQYGELVDCDDNDASVNPGATEEPYNGTDDDCNEDTPDDDIDGDGYLLANDCDDTNANINPGATEVCDGIDNDCSGTEDDALGGLWYPDEDEDGFGDESAAQTTCDPGSGLIDVGGDCNDDDDAINPDADEKCDSTDWNCDGETQQDVPGAPVWYPDLDGDGFGNPAGAITSCTQPTDYVDVAGDCDDNETDGDEVNPDEDEVCDDRDNDCDTAIDEGATDAGTWYLDHDGDGYGDADWSVVACDQPDNYVANATDCDDFDDTVYPTATEVCDGVLNDCNSVSDPDADAIDKTTWYPDNDHDGFGDPLGITVLACDDPSDGGDDYVTNSDDCNDTSDQAKPGGEEICGDSLDNDCDGTVNNAVDASLWFQDWDGDGHGDPEVYVWACATPESNGHPHVTAADADDCDDTDALINPDGTESATCNGDDEDCDGLVDEGAGSTTWYLDADGDTYGDDNNTITACPTPAPSVDYVSRGGDCNDLDTAYNPGASETCDGEDYDCDEAHDFDGDSDGFLDTADCSCTGRQPNAGSTTPTDCPEKRLDCDDGNGSIYPGKGCTGGASCLDIHEDWGFTLDGDYVIDNPAGGGTITVKCDLSDNGDRPGAGWTRVYRTDFETNNDGWKKEGGSDASTYTCTQMSTTILGNESDTYYYRLITTSDGPLDIPYENAFAQFEYYFIDDWQENAEAWFEFNLQRVWWVSGYNDSQSDTNMCDQSQKDRVDTVGGTLFTDGATSFYLFVGADDKGATQDGFGIDNVSVWVR